MQNPTEFSGTSPMEVFVEEGSPSIIVLLLQQGNQSGVTCLSQPGVFMAEVRFKLGGSCFTAHSHRAQA